MTIKKNLKYTENLIEMGKKLKQLRNIEGLSREELAELLDISDRMIYNYENGYNLINLEMIIKMYENNTFKERDLKDLVDIFIIDIFS